LQKWPEKYPKHQVRFLQQTHEPIIQILPSWARIGNVFSFRILLTHIILILQLWESSGSSPLGSTAGGILRHGELPFWPVFPSSHSAGSSKDPIPCLPSPLPRVTRVIRTTTKKPNPPPDYLSFKSACMYRWSPQLNAEYVKMCWKGLISFVFFILWLSGLLLGFFPVISSNTICNVSHGYLGGTIFLLVYVSPKWAFRYVSLNLWIRDVSLVEIVPTVSEIRLGFLEGFELMVNRCVDVGLLAHAGYLYKIILYLEVCLASVYVCPSDRWSPIISVTANCL